MNAIRKLMNKIIMTCKENPRLLKNIYIETYCLYIDFETLITFYNVNKYFITGMDYWWYSMKTVPEISNENY